MKITNDGLKIIRDYLDHTSNTLNINALGSLYWDSTIDTLCSIINDEEDVESFLMREKEYINAGLFPKIYGDISGLYDKITQSSKSTEVDIIFLTDFIKNSLNTIYSGDKKEELEFKYKLGKLKSEKCFGNFNRLKGRRSELLNDNTSVWNETDDLRLDIIRFEKQTSLGHFFSVDERRNFVEMKKSLEVSVQKYATLISSKSDSNLKRDLKEIEQKIASTLVDLVSSEIEIEKIAADIEKVKEESLSISKAAVEGQIREKLDYIREIVKLSAKRSRVANPSFLENGREFFTKERVLSIVQKIIEFDPFVFKNSRTSIFGKPLILLLPGTGNSIYDWKNNIFVVPLIPYNGNFDESIVSAFVEYRLDVDEDKLLLNSYNKLSCYKNIRSLIDIKSSFTRDYTKWITSECVGYKVLEADVRKWFEREIAPSRNDIYTPSRLQPFVLTSKESAKILQNSEKSSDRSVEDLWNLTVLNYQVGEFKKSFEYATELSQKDSNPLALYNLGIISIKNSQKQSALTALKEFILKHPQSWWASVAREHLRRLQLNG